MSLDVSLRLKRHITYDNGRTLIPDDELVYSGNITHNLNEMAMEAGIYEAVWRPYKLHPDFDKSGDDDCAYSFEKKTEIRAKNISEIIQKGVEDMRKKPEHYKKFDSPNGWGLYKDFMPFLEKYLEALQKYPEAIVECDR
jgi:hypothetical protein